MFIPKLGPTKRFPNGKIHHSDEGEIRMAIGHYEGNVVIDFGKPTTWIGLPPQQAHAALGGRTQ